MVTLLRDIFKYSTSSNDFLREINFGTDFLPSSVSSYGTFTSIFNKIYASL